MSWGNKLLITFIIFGSGMSFLVYKSVRTNFELVEKDYYKTELQYQATIDASSRFKSLKSDLMVDQQATKLQLTFPTDVTGTVTGGTILFYCAYGAGNDRKLPVVADKDGSMSIPYNLLARANYTMKVTWTAGGQEYYTEKQLSIRK